MYVVVRRYSGASALVDAMIERKDDVRALLTGVPGFKAYYAVRSGDGGSVTTITVCDSKDGTDESTRRAGNWVRENLAGASIGAPEINEGETYIAF
jgi:hypothetical protein